MLKTPINPTRQQSYDREPRKVLVIEWLSQQRKAWASREGHDGYLNSEERNASFDAYLEGK